MNVKQIKFNVDMPSKIHRLESSKALISVPQGPKELMWSLGKGPCGRYVEGLEVTITLSAVTIRQVSYKADPHAILRDWHAASLTGDSAKRFDIGQAAEENSKSREIKTFTYKLEDVRGRIEALEVGWS